MTRTIVQLRPDPILNTLRMWFPPLLLALSLIMALGLRAEARGPVDGFADLADTLSPSVVNITTTTNIATSDAQPMVPEGSPL
ncbi:MAG: hypothetical protein AAF245_12375, partial [Pseudomonadota bacterium]